MINWFLRSRIAKFEREFDYDMSYARDLLEVDRGAFLRFARASGMGEYHRDLPLPAWYAAKLVGTLTEDCGPCTQLVATMAERAGVAPTSLRAILAGNIDALPDDARLGYLFARATLAHDLVADEYREQVLQRWGRRALVSLSFAITAARIYPTLKYALGQGAACLRVRVGDVDVIAASQPA